MSIRSLASALSILGIKHHTVVAAASSAKNVLNRSALTYVGKSHCDTGSAIKWFSKSGNKPIELAGVTAKPKRGGVVFSIGNVVMTVSTNDNQMSIKLAGKEMPITAPVFMDITDRLATSNETVLKYMMRRFKYWAGVISKPAYLEKIKAAKNAKAAVSSIEALATNGAVEYGLWTGWYVITPSGVRLKTTTGIKGTVAAKVVTVGDLWSEFDQGRYKAFISDQDVADWRAGCYSGRKYPAGKYAGNEIKLVSGSSTAEDSDEDDKAQSLEDVTTPGPDQVATPIACTSSAISELKLTGKRDFTDFTGFKKRKSGSYDDRFKYTGDIEGQEVVLRQDIHGNVEVVLPFVLMSGKRCLTAVPVHNKDDCESLLSHIHRCFDLGY